MTVAEVVERLAAFRPDRPYPNGMSCHQRICVFCRAVGPYFDPPPVFPHDADCLWLAAKALAS